MARFLSGNGVSNAPSDLRVNTIFDRDFLVTTNAIQAEQTVRVLDASADNTVEQGWAEYKFNGSTFEKTIEQESLDTTKEVYAATMATSVDVQPNFEDNVEFTLIFDDTSSGDINFLNEITPSLDAGQKIRITINNSSTSTRNLVFGGKYIDSKNTNIGSLELPQGTDFRILEFVVFGADTLVLDSDSLASDSELSAIKVDANAGSVNLQLPTSTNQGLVKKYVNINLDNEASIVPAIGQTINGVIKTGFVDGVEFNFAAYPVGTTFEATEVSGGWNIAVIGASTTVTNDNFVYLEGAYIDHTTSNADEDFEVINLNSLVAETATAGFGVDIANNILGIGASISGDGGLNLPEGEYDVLFHLQHPTASSAGSSGTVQDVGGFRAGIAQALTFTEAEAFLFDASNSGLIVGYTMPPTSDILEETAVQARIFTNGEGNLYFGFRAAIDAADIEDFVIRKIEVKKVEGTTETVLAGMAQTEQVRVVEFARRTGVGFNVTQSLDNGRTWQDLIDDYEYIHVNYEFNYGSGSIAETKIIATSSINDDSEHVVRGTGTTYAVFDPSPMNTGTFAFDQGSGVFQISVEIVGVKAQKTVAGAYNVSSPDVVLDEAGITSGSTLTLDNGLTWNQALTLYDRFTITARFSNGRNGVTHTFDISDYDFASGTVIVYLPKTGAATAEPTITITDSSTGDFVWNYASTVFIKIKAYR